MKKVNSKLDKETLAQIGQSNESLLTITLQVAVPLWIHRMRHTSFGFRDHRATVCSDYIAEHGDIVLYKGDKKGESAEGFNRLAEGIACLAYQPGGVKAFGLHFTAESDWPFEYIPNA